MNRRFGRTAALWTLPQWGRAQETYYGEDPHHLGVMGAAFICGAQEEVVASVKHYALNSIEDTRFDVSVEADERTLREVYQARFGRRAAIDHPEILIRNTPPVQPCEGPPSLSAEGEKPTHPA